VELIKLLDEIDALEKAATPAPWDGYDNIQPVRNRDFILTLRNNWPRISKALREAKEIISIRKETDHQRLCLQARGCHCKELIAGKWLKEHGVSDGKL